MESQRSILIIGLLLVSFLLWTNYQSTYGPKPYQEVNSDNSQLPSEEGDTFDGYIENNATSLDNTGDVEQFSLDADNSVTTNIVETATKGRIISVNTGTLDVKIDLHGGDIIQTNLLQFPIEQGSDKPYPLLKPETAVKHIAQSFLIGTNGSGADKSTADRAIYSTEKQDYVLDSGTLTIPLMWQSGDGLIVKKIFTFTENSHIVDVNYEVTNNRSQATSLALLARLEQTLNDVGGSSMFMPTFRGSAYSHVDDRYEKLSFSDIADENLRIATPAGWVAMIEHYFVAAWIPPQEDTNVITARLSNSSAIISVTGKTVKVPANGNATFNSKLYVGPKDQDTLKSLARGLDLTVDYGPLWWLSQVLFDLLRLLHSFTMNWGVAIILITLIVKGAMFWLTKKQYESMAKMRNLQPKMTQLKDRFGDDRQKMSKAMMDLYKKEKVNPMGGCFPLLLQMPIFLALYWVLLESVELRHADFAFWITDLSIPDPFFILPILTGVSMWMLQRLQPMTIQDPLQQKLMQWMPVAMSVFFVLFPAGLVLYWLISNVVTLVQAKIIYASMEKRGIKSK